MGVTYGCWANHPTPSGSNDKGVWILSPAGLSRGAEFPHLGASPHGIPVSSLCWHCICWCPLSHPKPQAKPQAGSRRARPDHGKVPAPNHGPFMAFFRDNCTEAITCPWAWSPDFHTWNLLVTCPAAQIALPGMTQASLLLPRVRAGFSHPHSSYRPLILVSLHLFCLDYIKLACILQQQKKKYRIKISLISFGRLLHFMGGPASVWVTSPARECLHPWRFPIGWHRDPHSSVQSWQSGPPEKEGEGQRDHPGLRQMSPQRHLPHAPFPLGMQKHQEHTLLLS